MAYAQKNELKPWLRQPWVIPPKQNAAFVVATEDVPDVYARPHDPARPAVCVDEGGKQLIGDVRGPLPVRPRRPARQDSEYERGGMADPFMCFEPLAGVRHAGVTERKTSVDFARCLRTVSDTHYADAGRIVPVCDNFSTHTPAASYEAFGPDEAHRLARRFEWHHPPRHGSRLDMAETELSVLARQCLDRRVPDAATPEREVAAWERQRNAAAVKVHWQFTTADARTKLHRLYPTIPLQ